MIVNKLPKITRLNPAGGTVKSGKLSFANYRVLTLVLEANANTDFFIVAEGSDTDKPKASVPFLYKELSQEKFTESPKNGYKLGVTAGKLYLVQITADMLSNPEFGEVEFNITPTAAGSVQAAYAFQTQPRCSE